MNLLAIIVAVLPLFSFALTLPAGVQVGDNKQELKIIYHKAADSNITVEVLSADGLVGRALSSSLDSGAFEKLPIIFDVDERGSGNLTVGTSTYLIHEDVNYSGGIVCGLMFNKAEAAVSCTVAVPADLPLQPLGKIDTVDGTPDGPRGLARVLRVAANPSSGPMDTFHSMWGQPPPADTRPNPNDCYDVDPPGKTELIGDGDPHQNYFDIQLSENMRCGAAPSCSVGYTESQGISIAFTVSTDFGVANWISAGFQVTTTWTTGTDYHCSGGPGDTVCIWYGIAHTAYTVRNKFRNRCTGYEWYSDPVILSSPNIANAGGGEYCVIGEQYCQSAKFSYWDYDGPAGGP